MPTKCARFVMCLVVWSVVFETYACGQNFVFQRTSSQLKTRASAGAIIDATVDAPAAVTDTSSGALSSVNTAAAVGGLGGDVVMHDGMAQSALNPDGQPILQVSSQTAATGFADVRDINTWNVAGGSSGQAEGRVTAQLVQLNGSGGSTTARYVVDIDSSRVLQTGGLYNMGMAFIIQTNSSGGVVVNGTLMVSVTADPIAGDVWADQGGTLTYVGNLYGVSTMHFESAPLVINDGASVTLNSFASSVLDGQLGWAVYDAGVVTASMSSVLTTLP